jgi:hypothetical protein
MNPSVTKTDNANKTNGAASAVSKSNGATHKLSCNDSSLGEKEIEALLTKPTSENASARYRLSDDDTSEDDNEIDGSSQEQ